MSAQSTFNRPAVRLAHPRRFGLVLVAAGLIMNGMNWYEITTNNKYWIMSLAIGPAGFLFGLWRVAIGQPWNVAANRMARWASIGDGITFAIGFAISAYLFFLMNHG